MDSLPLEDEKACQERLSSIGDALYVIGGKWRLRIIVALLHGKHRFNDLQRSITGISSKVLASELKALEMNGFIKRNVVKGAPVIIDYELTSYAVSLQPVLDALSEWGAMHRRKISQRMKEEFDAAR